MKQSILMLTAVTFMLGACATLTPKTSPTPEKTTAEQEKMAPDSDSTQPKDGTEIDCVANPLQTGCSQTDSVGPVIIGKQ